MISKATLAIAASALVSVSAAPVEPRGNYITLSVSKYSNVTSMMNIVNKGTQFLSQVNGNNADPEVGNNDATTSGTVTNDDVSYVAPVVIGGRTQQLIVDTGSSNLWCGARSACEATSSGRSTGNSFQISYGSGSVSGTEYTDSASFGGQTVSKQSLGSASQSSGFSGVDGIIGFGPVDLTEGTVSNTNTVPTFMDNLYSQKSIPSEVLGVSFRPESGSDTDDANGELTLGGTDSSKYSGSITYFPKLTSGDASAYWGIASSGFTYGSTSLASSASCIVDTGTTLIYIPTGAYNKFLSATGGKTDSNSGLASFTTKPTQNVNFKFGSSSFPLTPAQYLVPTAQYSYYGLSSGKYYSWIGAGGTSGVDCIIGQKFLENYYAVFDTTNSRIGFATGV